MIKKELIREVARLSSVTIKDTAMIIDNVFEVITQGLVKDGVVKIKDFGSFCVRRRRKANGVNTHGEPCIRSPINKIKFDSYTILATLINKK